MSGSPYIREFYLQDLTVNTGEKSPQAYSRRRWKGTILKYMRTLWVLGFLFVFFKKGLPSGKQFYHSKTCCGYISESNLLT